MMSVKRIVKTRQNKIELNIGNLTLLEGKNSENGHKGNSSAGCKDHAIKAEMSYRGSSSKITRIIAADYKESFGENEISSRGSQIAKLLDMHSRY